MKIDHLIWFSPDLRFGETFFIERAGVKPVFSGPHPGGRTRNSIFATSDTSFVDVMAMDPAQPESGANPEVAEMTGHGLYHWAMGDTDLEALVDRARSKGVVTSDVLTGGRERPSGEWLGWKVVGVRNHGFGALIPVFIEWTNAKHPAFEARIGGQLLSVTLYSPKQKELTALLDVLGIEVTVKNAAVNAMEATLEGPTGPYMLRSFDPLPVGFEI